MDFSSVEGKFVIVCKPIPANNVCKTLHGIVQKAAANAPEKKAPRLVALKKAIGRRAKAAARRRMLCLP